MIKLKEHLLNATLLGDEQRKIRVYLPKNYEENQVKRYPVLYMHDGQNMMDPSVFSNYSWNIPAILFDLEQKGVIEGVIIVGIDSSQTKRISEFTYHASKRGLSHFKKSKEGEDFFENGKNYARFLLEVVKPFVDQTYRTKVNRKDTGVFGSSCGGNISLELMLNHHDVFGIVGAFSPAYWIIKEPLFSKLKESSLNLNTIIYHDMGGKESKFFSCFNVLNSKQFHKILINKGFDSKHLKMVIDPVATHTELFWQDRFPEFIRFSFSREV